MKKALITATVFAFLNFEKNDMRILKSLGYEVHTATNMNEAAWLQDDGSFSEFQIVRHQIDYGRSPFSRNSIKAYKEIKTLIEKEKFDLIHCHTPVAAAITRIAAKKSRNNGTKVIYTSHGFHFHKKSGLKNWLLYYPVEKILSKYTDMIITINKEDYGVIQGFSCNYKRYIPSVGIDTEYIQALNPEKLVFYKELGIPYDAKSILCIGELSDRKNQKVLIEAISRCKKQNIYLVLCGTGCNLEKYKKQAVDLGISEHVIFTGQKQHDWVLNLCHVIDIGAIPSRIEGFGLAGIEMLACGKPVIGSNIQGIKDYIVDGENGFLVEPDDVDGIAQKIIEMLDNPVKLKKMGIVAQRTTLSYDKKIVSALMYENYKTIDS